MGAGTDRAIAAPAQGDASSPEFSRLDVMRDDHERIWLQPKCCASGYEGRLWCEDPDPAPCPDGVPWTEYVRADLVNPVGKPDAKDKPAR